MKKIKSLVIACLVLISFGAAAQQQSFMRFNEVLVSNIDGYQDDYGVKGQWIELFNSSYGTVNIAGCYLTNDPNNLTKYMFPKGDNATQIPPRQFCIVWADGQASKGTFYTNFNIAPGEELLFVGGDGRTIIDRVQITPSLGDNQSFARVTDGDGEWAIAQAYTPQSANVTNDAESKSQQMKRMDPYGAIMSFTAMSVVFTALAILFLIFKQIGKMSIKKTKKNIASSNASVAVKSAAAAAEQGVSGETFAAIAMAFHLFSEENEAHDEESFVVTLNHTDRTYSPWSSKIYGLRETPQIKRN